MPDEDHFAIAEERLPSKGHLLAVSGEIDLFTAPELKQKLGQVLSGTTSRVVVDLSETTFLDSTGLGVLIGALKRVRSRDGSLILINVDETIAKTFEITGLDQIFTICATRDEAVAALSEDGSQTA